MKQENNFDKKAVLSSRGGTTPEEKTAGAYSRLYELVRILRSPDGCPWDREQTPQTMRRDLVEEVFEAVDAISSMDGLHAKEELGDVMLNATMISYMYEQQGAFELSEALDELCDKLIRRHPHVFPESEGASQMNALPSGAEQVLSQWDKIKENVEGRATDSILDQVPEGFPPLLKAYKMQKKASKKGFDWGNPSDSLKKVREELEETVNASSEKNILHIEEEIGDLLFAVVDYARQLGVDPEVALSRTNKKFYQRFTYVERKMNEEGIPMTKEQLSLMEKLWNEAKENSSKID